MGQRRPERPARHPTPQRVQEHARIRSRDRAHVPRAPRPVCLGAHPVPRVRAHASGARVGREREASGGVYRRRAHHAAVDPRRVVGDGGRARRAAGGRDGRVDGGPAFVVLLVQRYPDTLSDTAVVVPVPKRGDWGEGEVVEGGVADVDAAVAGGL